MGCNSCKNKGGVDDLNVFINDKGERESTPKDFGFRVFNVLIRIVLFVISLIIVPVIILLVIYLLFKTIILNNGTVDLMPAFLKLAKSIGIGKKRVEEEHPEDYEDLDPDNPDEYELDERVDKIKL